MYLDRHLMITAAQEIRMRPFEMALANARKGASISLRVPSESANLKMDLHPGNCAIPLLNTLKDDKSISNMPTLKPQGDFKMPIITPVPVCENFGK